jgi:hypothetical protein
MAFSYSDKVLLKAAVRGSDDKVQRLLDNGADVNARDANGTTPLMLSSFRGHFTVLKVLLSAGADVNLEDKQGTTALMLASAGGDMRIVQALIDAGAKVNAKNYIGWTPLMMAAKGGHVHTVQALLTAGADPDVKNKDSETALMLMTPDASSTLAQLLKRPEKDAGPPAEKGIDSPAEKDTDPPAITILTPRSQEPTSVPTEQTQVTIRAQIRDASQLGIVAMNNTPVTLDAEGRFVAEAPLQQGKNLIVVAAQDIHGNRAKRTLTIHRLAPAIQQSVTVIQPPQPEKSTPIQVRQYALTVETTPSDSTIKILNIKPRYHPGILLSPGRYHLSVEKTGYRTLFQWIQLQIRT